MDPARRRLFGLRAPAPAAAPPTPQATSTTPAAAGRAVLQVAPCCLLQHGVACQLCGDVCEPRALRFRPARGGLAELSVDQAACSACGECVPLCPVGAIRLLPAAPATAA